MNPEIMFEFTLKTHLKMGAGCAKMLHSDLFELGFKRIGIVVDVHAAKTHYIRTLLKSLQKSRKLKAIIWFYNLQGEPDYDSLDRVKLLFLDAHLQTKVDCFVGIGGGSVMDFAKGLSTLVVNHGPAIQYRGFPREVEPSLPTVTIPTVAGTGSEITYNASFIDWEGKKKMGINTHYNFPVLSYLDPLCTVSCPLEPTVSSAVDSLVHTIESYTATKASSLTKALSRAAFPYIFNSLSHIRNNLKDLHLRADLQYGSCLAGMSLMNSGSGPAAALSYPLGVHFKVSHGIAGGFFLPHIVHFNVERGFDYSDLYDSISTSNTLLSKRQKNRLFSKKLFILLKKVGVSTRLGKFGVNNMNVAILINEIEGLEGAFAQNSIPYTTEDGKRLVYSLL